MSVIRHQERDTHDTRVDDGSIDHESTFTHAEHIWVKRGKLIGKHKNDKKLKKGVQKKQDVLTELKHEEYQVLTFPICLHLSTVVNLNSN
jgi:hypothetical protein